MLLMLISPLILSLPFSPLLCALEADFYELHFLGYLAFWCGQEKSPAMERGWQYFLPPTPVLPLPCQLAVALLPQRVPLAQPQR